VGDRGKGAEAEAERTGEKLLTLAIPAYNAEETLGRTLDSIVGSPALPLLEVIVVNDGSHDSTGSLARSYQSPSLLGPSLRVVDEENRGHGGALNLALSLSQGKYFRGLDADDFIRKENLPLFLSFLSRFSSDAVVTPFRTLDGRGKVIGEYGLRGIRADKEYPFPLFWKSGKGVRPPLCYHGITYRSSFLKEGGFSLSEKTWYEDQEYATLPFSRVKTILPLSLPLYEYVLGREDQSVSNRNQSLRFPHLERVHFVPWEAYCKGEEGMSREGREYFLYKMGEKLLSCYTSLLLKGEDRGDGGKEAFLFRSRLKERSPLLYKRSGKAYLVTILLSFLKIRGEAWARLRRFPLYPFFRALVH
jgi:glycosyltransferase involved in cell wall biosynthesis